MIIISITPQTVPMFYVLIMDGKSPQVTGSHFIKVV